MKEYCSALLTMIMILYPSIPTIRVFPIVEPTNHLDLETTEALIEAIKNFQGGVLLVSHDQHLLTSVCKHLYVVQDGKVELLRQGMTNGEAFEKYKKDVIAGRR